jgi:hypothetical protein
MLEKMKLKNTVKIISALGISSAISLLVAPSSARALTITPYSTITSFEAATTQGASINNINFSGIVTNAYAQQNNPYVVVNNGSSVTFGEVSSGANSLYVVNNVNPFTFEDSQTNNVISSLVDSAPLFNQGPSGISATLPTGITAVGVDLLATNTTTNSFTVTFQGVDGTTTQISENTLAAPTSEFFGFTSNVAIASVSFVPTSSSAYAEISNFKFGTAVGVAPGVPFETNSALGIAVLGCFWGTNFLRKKMKNLAT